MTYEEIIKGLEKAKDTIYIHEMGNDMYYSSNQWKEDKEELYFWEQKQKEFIMQEGK